MIERLRSLIPSSEQAALLSYMEGIENAVKSELELGPVTITNKSGSQITFFNYPEFLSCLEALRAEHAHEPEFKSVPLRHSSKAVPA